MQAASGATQKPSDQECLEAWRRGPGAATLRPLLERYGAFVYSSALRRTGSADSAADLTRAVFLVLARRARKLRKTTVLAGWLFHVTAIACRKQMGKARRPAWWNWFKRKPKSDLPPDATLWTRVAPEIDMAIDHLPAAQRNAVLLRVLLNQEWESVARTLRTNERRAVRRADRGLKKLARRLRQPGTAADLEALAHASSAEACVSPLPEGLALSLLETIEATLDRRPTFKLARRSLNALAWARWRRRFVIGVPVFGVLLAILGGIAWQIDARTGHSRLIATVVIWSVRWGAGKVTEPARTWPTNAAVPRLAARSVRGARDLYQTTNVWLAHLSFTREQWKALDPKSIGSLPNFVRPDGLWLLRNPKARRSGLIGVLGYDFDWTHAGFELGDLAFTNVAVRVKGNAGSMVGLKRPFKVDLNRFTRGQKLGGLDELTFNNLFWDYSYLSDALAYEFFRDAGVPASRTAYAWISASVATQWDRKPLGLYLMLEPVDAAFAGERFGSRKTPILKPVTYNLFEYLGDDWSSYAAIYDLKTKATADQRRRVIEFARLVTSATDAEFAAQVGGFLDLDEFARFLASEVLLSSYDGILTDGQNFYLYLDPHSNKFGFIPWDLDSAWGNFWIGTEQELERASLWHPWVGENRFIERVMAGKEFRRIYRACLEDFLARLFVPHRLYRQIDEMVAVLRGPIAAESAFRLNKFEQAVGLKPLAPSLGETSFGPNRPAFPLKRFIETRAKSVRQQLDGKSTGIILKTPAQK